MKKLFFALILTAIVLSNFQSSYSSDWYEAQRIIVGKQPVLYYAGDSENSEDQSVFCLGYDADFDGVFEPEDGDEYPSWWSVQANFYYWANSIMGVTDNGTKLRDFEFSMTKSFPFRPGIDEDQKRLYLNQNGKIVVFHLETGEIVDSNFAEFDPVAISVSEDKLFISIRVDIGNNYTIDSNYVLILDKEDGSVIDKIETEDMVQQTLLYEDKLIILCEGLNRIDDSKIMFVDISQSEHVVLETMAVGGGGNHILLIGDTVFVTLNGSHEVKMIDIEDYEVKVTFEIPTEGYDGPRESCSYGKYKVHTSAYNGKIYYLDFINSSVGELVSCDGKVEGIYSTIGYVLANIQNSMSYAPDSVVVLYSNMTTVRYIYQNFNGTIYPNPVQDNASVEFSIEDLIIEDVSLEIVDLLGNSTELGNFLPVDGLVSFDLNIDDLNLASGQYYIIAKSSNGLKSMPITVIR